MTATDLTAMLAVRYSAPAWAFLAQVRNGTGYAKRTTRTADAMAFSLWPSRGLELHGFEIKTYRGDWVREMRDPEKAEDLAGYCDRWWIVGATKDIVQPGELPPTWGFMAPRGDKLVAITEAPKLPEPKALDRVFIAAVLRRASESMVPVDALEKLVATQAEKVVENERRGLKIELEESARLRERVQLFEQWSGLDLREHRWPYATPETLGRAVRTVLESNPEKLRKEMQFIRDRAAKLVEQCNEALALPGEESAA